MAMPNLQFNKVGEDSISVTGELTRDTLVNESFLNQLLENAQSVLYFDLCEVSRVDTAGLAWLIHSLGKLKRQGVRLELKNRPEQLQNLMELGQVTNLFE
ncbi:anti-sigma B factor antagonist [Pseudoalteromonas luteoviolacea NCIMB 1942]|uniref:Anti-sigma B factor antagonist n=2 Tax=Pseudoalteromonas luteoviolacea TaxID=43657 RepID=A0A167ETU5_9GAMM|nr:anti-sigma B factor antagonist [Pseudoalteromonas luteoviolacea NCIMB 1942]